MFDLQCDCGLYCTQSKASVPEFTCLTSAYDYAISICDFVILKYTEVFLWVVMLRRYSIR